MKNSNKPINHSIWLVFCGSLAYWFNTRQEARNFTKEQFKYGGLVKNYSKPIKYCKDY